MADAVAVDHLGHSLRDLTKPLNTSLGGALNDLFFGLPSSDWGDEQKKCLREFSQRYPGYGIATVRQGRLRVLTRYGDLHLSKAVIKGDIFDVIVFRGLVTIVTDGSYGWHTWSWQGAFERESNCKVHVLSEEPLGKAYIVYHENDEYRIKEFGHWQFGVCEFEAIPANLSKCMFIGDSCVAEYCPPNYEVWKVYIKEYFTKTFLNK